MNKKRGFTLIELLAVIVILAIIALIATPIIMNVIESSKKGAAERSAENYLRGIETKIIEEKMETGKFLSDGTYTLTELESKLGTIEVSGTKATEASIIVRDGQVLDGSTLEVNNYVVNIIDGAGKVGEFGTVLDLFTTTETEVVDFIKGQNSQTPTITYNPVTEEKDCNTENDETCFGWYVLEDKGAEYATVSLIMNDNLTNSEWIAIDKYHALGGEDDNTPGSACYVTYGRECAQNIFGPVTLLENLKASTSTWNVMVSLPTFDQIQNASGCIYNNYCNIERDTWLMSNLNPSTNAIYWTLTAAGNGGGLAFAVNFFTPGMSSIYIGNSQGVRPVITVLKSEL